MLTAPRRSRRRCAPSSAFRDTPPSSTLQTRPTPWAARCTKHPPYPPSPLRSCPLDPHPIHLSRDVSTSVSPSSSSALIAVADSTDKCRHHRRYHRRHCEYRHHTRSSTQSFHYPLTATTTNTTTPSCLHPVTLRSLHCISAPRGPPKRSPTLTAQWRSTS